MHMMGQWDFLVDGRLRSIDTHCSPIQWLQQLNGFLTCRNLKDDRTIMRFRISKSSNMKHLMSRNSYVNRGTGFCAAKSHMHVLIQIVANISLVSWHPYIPSF